MLSRTLVAITLASLAFASGCCCPGACGPCGAPGGACCWCLRRPIVWNGNCNDCGPGPCQSCDDACGACGIIPALRRGMTCGKGCGEIYIGEWISDPPDCCDPCDQCYGHWTGPAGGPCCLGPFQRLLAAFHGYSYCPRPDCGPACGGLCNRGSCGPACGCGGVGCATCGGGAHGAVLGDVQYGGMVTQDVLPAPAATKLAPTPADPQHSILDENWNIPRAKPVPGKPIHKAQQPHGQMGRAQPRQASQNGPRVAAQSRAVGTGVRQASYTR
jgi:hypothetical protein